MNPNPTVYNWAECVDDITAIAKRLLERIPDIQERSSAAIASARIIHDMAPKRTSSASTQMHAVETPVVRGRGDYR